MKIKPKVYRDAAKLLYEKETCGAWSGYSADYSCTAIDGIIGGDLYKHIYAEHFKPRNKYEGDIWFGDRYAPKGRLKSAKVRDRMRSERYIALLLMAEIAEDL